MTDQEIINRFMAETSLKISRAPSEDEILIGAQRLASLNKITFFCEGITKYHDGEWIKFTIHGFDPSWHAIFVACDWIAYTDSKNNRRKR